MLQAKRKTGVWNNIDDDVHTFTTYDERKMLSRTLHDYTSEILILEDTNIENGVCGLVQTNDTN